MRQMTELLSSPMQLRLEYPNVADRTHQSALGQFMTPAPVARFMASLFRPIKGPLRLIDPGAGIGALATAALECWSRGELGRGHMEVVAHEMDERLHSRLENVLGAFSGARVKLQIVEGDYLRHAADAIKNGAPRFTHAILNPPYKKIGSASESRLTCRDIGLETVNLYSAFVGMALAQLAPKGQLVAIIPRSFCNGPYYRPFRKFMLTRAAIHQIHLFESRNQTFRDDGVLQENVIMLLERDGVQGDVRISSSTDGTFADLRQHLVPFGEIVKLSDKEAFIHIPTDGSVDSLERATKICHSLDELEINVSTGPVVDFRLREHLVAMPRRGAVPLLYPSHLDGRGVSWPIEGLKKANAILRNEETQRWLFPVGAYTLIRRFSSKEEKRRIMASIMLPDSFEGYKMVGFENHLNVFHRRKKGLPIRLAWGLFAYLNCSAVDAHFRRFNGHTQVNVADLKSLRYPSVEAMTSLGKWAESAKTLEQNNIDRRMEHLLA